MIFVVSCIRKKYYSSLKPNKVTDNKAFWKTIKPFLSDKETNINKITLLDNDKVISDYFSGAIRTFKNIPAKCLKVTSDICSPFLAVI